MTVLDKLAKNMGDRRQKSEDRMTEDRRQKTGGRDQKSKLKIEDKYACNNLLTSSRWDVNPELSPYPRSLARIK